MHDHLILAIALFISFEILIAAALLRMGRTVAKRREFNEAMTEVPDMIDHTKN